jgi:transcriptional regulator with XRE-family HTH domain
MTSTKQFWRDYSHRLRVTRLALGITEADAAEAHGVTLATYQKWEAGCRQLTVGFAIRFAEKYEVSLDWLIEGEAGNVGRHLAGGKVAILPVMSARRRRQLGEGRPTLGGAA